MQMFLLIPKLSPEVAKQVKEKCREINFVEYYFLVLQ